MRPDTLFSGYREKDVLITGGLGFIGSNLAIRLVQLGARVTVVDCSERGCGANPYNLKPVESDVRLLPADIAAAASFRSELAASEIVFNLAGEISHIHSMRFPERDARINAAAQLQFVEACARYARGVRVVYASTRQIYGVPQSLPVDESHPVRPVDFNGIHKYAATMYHEMSSESGGIDGVSLCLTNVYGPRMALDIPCQGVLSNFLRKSIQGKPLEIFGDGRQLRDPLYVDDAVDAFLAAGLARPLASRRYNAGGPEALELREIAQVASRAAGNPEPIFRDFPADRKAIDIGSYYTNSSRIRSELQWEPKVPFADGISRSIAWYRKELQHYLDPRKEPVCKLERHGDVKRIPTAV